MVKRKKNTEKASDSDAGSDLEAADVDNHNPPTSSRQSHHPSSKKLKKTEKADSSLLTNAQGDKYISLGKKKRATMYSFKGKPLLDVREFYGTEGDEKPGKKGISITREQWDVLKNNTSAIEAFFVETSAA